MTIVLVLVAIVIRLMAFVVIFVAFVVGFAFYCFPNAGDVRLAVRNDQATDFSSKGGGRCVRLRRGFRRGYTIVWCLDTWRGNAGHRAVVESLLRQA